jgi:hypothetical protein
MLLKKELTDYNRYQAFAIHMAMSLVIFFFLLICITQYWYPGILFDTGNGWKAIGMIVGIDLVLGPLLTLIVFNPLKSSLKFDLSIIALIQTVALIYGTWTIHQTRPIALAFINTSFMTVFASNPLSEGIQDQTKSYNTYELFYNFDTNLTTTNLQADKFKPYSEYAHLVAKTQSAYRVDDLFEIDPLISSKRYIEIHPQTGSIVRFIHK